MTATSANNSSVLEVRDVFKTYRIGFFRKKIEAVRGLSFKIEHGEMLGFVGPNGAGKTTTMKMILQLIYPSSGSITLFGTPTGNPKARARLGYLPENPYIYSYLKPLEFLDLCGRLVGLDGRERRKRAIELTGRLGLSHALDRPVGKFSKGMMQRLGFCQALLHDPEFLILDEPFSGLDPIGRKDIRDALLEQRSRGKTMLMTSHVLTDVEMLCDQIAIVQRGKLVASGKLDELLKPDVRRVEVELDNVSPELAEKLRAQSTSLRELHGHTFVLIEGDANVPGMLQLAIEAGAHVHAVIPHRETLEDLFVRKAVAEAAA
jgi:ABC-2 type transport system ATP-binding protein